MRRHSLIQRAVTPDSARAQAGALGRALALAALLGSTACSSYDGTARWEGVYLPESEIDRPKGVMVAMDAGQPDGGADAAATDGSAADGAPTGDAAPADAAPADAADADAANGDAADGDAAPADAAPAG